jgi:hypothetical protein
MLTWKDGVTTILAIAVLGLYYVTAKGIDLPIFTGYRWSIGIVAIIGITMCALSGGGESTASGSNPFTILASILGVAAFLFIVYGLIAGTKLAVILLAVTVLLLWGIATVRHIVSV